LSDSDPFTELGAPIAEDMLMVDLGFDGKIADRVIAGASYSGRYGEGTAIHGFHARLNARF
ncbi:MAG: hypothetical protein K5905_17735, partial [Roseibium sp.]|nr:hypothetical protein [Roseibium sp.]